MRFKSIHLAKSNTRIYKKIKENTQTLVHLLGILNLDLEMNRSTLIISLDYSSDHLGSWSWVNCSLILSQLFVEIKHLKPGSSWSWSSVISINNQCLDRMSPPVLAYKQSVQTLSCLSAEPVRGACLDIMLKWRIYQFSLLSSKHYILKKMNPTTTVFLVQRVYSSASIIGVVLVRIL